MKQKFYSNHYICSHINFYANQRPLSRRLVWILDGVTRLDFFLYVNVSVFKFYKQVKNENVGL